MSLIVVIFVDKVTPNNLNTMKMINVNDNDTCAFCNANPETITHLFWEYDIVNFKVNCMFG